MTNDTSTLTGALRELGETMAANLTTQGVPSTYDEGLTTLAGKILDIQGGGGYTKILVSSSSDILSYYDGDFCTVTAQLADANDDPVAQAGVSIQLYKDNVLWDTIQTDNTGKVTKTYTSAGVGDVEFEATDGTLSSETYSIEDCYYYNDTVYSSTSTSLNVPLPEHFILEYILHPNARYTSGGSEPYLDVGDSSNNRMLVGQYARAGTNGFIIYQSSNTNLPYGTVTTYNQDNTIKFTYDGSNYLYQLNDGEVMTVSDYGVTLSKLMHIESGSVGGGTLRNIKIKSL